MNTEHAPGGRRPSGELETQVLCLLHTVTEPLTPRQVGERLGIGLSYSTVVTVLSRMHDKGVLRRDRHGRAFAYAPVADPAGLTARRMRQMMEADADRDTVLARFVGDLSPHDERVLRELLGGADDGDRTGQGTSE